MTLQKITLACTAALAVAATASLAHAASNTAAPPVVAGNAHAQAVVAIGNAVAAPDRPAEDTARDALRKPVQLIAFAGLQPGQSVADIAPGGGYFTRIFSHLVGADGHVYAIVPDELVKAYAKAGDGAKALAADPALSNVTALTEPLASLAVGKQLDMAWISENYHDIYNGMGAEQALAMDKAVFQALKPGGIFIVTDHVAQAGTPQETVSKLHRIDPEIVKQQALAAGFELAGSSDLLRNPDDPHDVAVFSPTVRGHTDQFVLKFIKPADAKQ